MEVLFWGRQGLYISWFTKGKVDAVATGSDYWAGCRGLYKLSCRSSLALVNKDGEASEACAEGTCVDGAYIDKSCAGRGCADGAYTGGAYTDGGCTGRSCTGGAYIGGACVGGVCTNRACADRAYADRACRDGACIVARVGRLGRGSSFKACRLIAFS